MNEILHELIDDYEKKFGVSILEIYNARRPKRFTVKIKTKNGVKLIDFGSNSRETFFDYRLNPEKFDKEKMFKKRDNYQKRHSAIKLKDGRRAIDVVSPASLSYYLLW